jgi:hypothetical protein
VRLGSLLVAWGSAFLVCACSGNTPHPPLLHSENDAGSSTLAPRRVCVDDAAPPAPNAQGFCGNTFLAATTDHPNLYFVIDRSGSMQEFVDGEQKYAAVVTAATSLVRSLGPQANVGAAVFPGRTVDEQNPCAAGEEVFTTRPGDALPTGSCGDGPVTRGFANAVSPTGGAFGATPTASTLTALLPLLDRLPGRTAVILATDGGPNCNGNAACKADKCIPNIEKQCQPDINCCTQDTFGPEACLDEDPTRDAVRALSMRRIPTYVIGIPGSGPYADLLEQLALAGGTARPIHPAYYDAKHLVELDAVLASIGAKVVLSCHLRLEAPPPNRALVNVYIDRELLTYGSADGWIWSDFRDGGVEEREAEPLPADASEPAEVALDLVGEACAKLESGQVQQVQIVFGCPTAIVR